MTGFMHFFLTVCDAYTCKLTKLRFLVCIIRYSRYYRYFFFDIDISIFFNIATAVMHLYENFYIIIILQENSSNVSEEELLSTHDGKSLHALVQELVKCKEDSQQRSWALHEDEGVITKCLKDVISIVVSRFLLVDFQSALPVSR
jgi:hypothetical protein